MNLINPTPEEVEAEYQRALTVMKILKDEVLNRIWAKKLGIPLSNQITETKPGEHNGIDQRTS